MSAKQHDVPRATRWPAVGALLWIACIHYFIIQLVVGLAYSTQYSVLHNTISDLGNTVCGPYRDTIVCSPLYGLMNASFIITGLLMAIGSLLIYRTTRKGLAGFIAMALSGVGSILVGLFPENTVSALHVAGAALVFGLGNLALLLFAWSPEMPKALRYYTLASGLIALVALVLFLNETYLGLGIGGMERLTAYPQTIWLIVYGTYLLRKRRTTR